MTWCVIGRGRAAAMSSSRVSISFTGFLTMLAITAACTGASGQMRRPKPPPSSCRLILILSGVVLSTPATTAAASGCTCVPTQISADVPSSETLATAFIGSIWA